MRSVSKRVQLSHLKRGAAAAALLTMTGLAASLLPGAAWAEEAAAPTEAAIVQNEVQDALGEADEALTGTEAGDAQPESRAEGRRDKDCKAWWDHKPWRGPGYDPCDQKDRKHHKKCPPHKRDYRESGVAESGEEALEEGRGWHDKCKKDRKDKKCPPHKRDYRESGVTESGEEALEEGRGWHDKCKKDRKDKKDWKHKKCPPHKRDYRESGVAESGEEALEEGRGWHDKCKKDRKDKKDWKHKDKDKDDNDLLPVTGSRNLMLGGAGLMLIGAGLFSWLLAGRRRVRA